MPDFCPRCFWLKLRLNNKLPFQMFPGIFSSIDSYTKNIIHGYFDQYQQFPSWLGGLGELKRYINPPHFSKFNIIDTKNDILLTGVPDGIFVKTDASHIIVDYKTAKYTGTQDKLMPVYEIQLNAYALIGEEKGLHPVSGLTLIYMEPVTGKDATCDGSHCQDNGFAMDFSASIHPVSLAPERVPPLLAQTRDIYEMQEPPDGLAGCKDCQLLEDMINIAAG